MKKKTILVAILSFFLSTCIGYFYGRGTQDMVAEEPMEITLEESMEVNQKTNTIATDGQLIYQYYYTKDHTLKEQQEVTPDFLVGLTREQLESIYPNWQLILFSPDKVILRCKIEKKSDEVYLLAIYDGCVTLFYENEDMKLEMKEKTSIPIAVLPEREQKQLQEGIYVYGEENLIKLLSDFVS
ncbi:BofC C-terminal domain-containing protein [Chakrabartyella piscis]|uniref:BofC C-terminal domain-containing protein n=1 Tax=Chakrabartyella piscis TaxID=2918914 RepID=UPI0029586DB0|nr:BofC C-terminal domain-containing protein [Chakrabartyella piscis]